MSSASAGRITLYEASEGLQQVDAWIEEHADEILANGGALPPALAELLDQAEGTLKVKLERVAMTVRALAASAEACKHEAARLSQRATMWDNAGKALKAYAKRCLEAAGLPSVKTDRFTVRVQKNPASLRHALDGAKLLAIHDEWHAKRFNPEAADPPLFVDYIHVERVATLDARGVLDALKGYKETLSTRAAEEYPFAEDDSPETRHALEEFRASYVARNLASEFPGMTVEQGTHLRIA